ncbi:DUF6259 domain-containing protein [Fredinandcohnia humi]
MILLESNSISISFSKESGSICSLVDKQKGIEYISGELSSCPFRVDLGGEIISDFTSFSYILDEKEVDKIGYRFIWTITENIRVNAYVMIASESNEITFECEVYNASEKEITSLEYPIIPNIGKITENGKNDYFAHSLATGFKIHNPLDNFSKDSNGFRYIPYPEGFSGATMQFFSYYGLGKGGLYFATYDGESYSKWLNFYRNDNELLEASFIHGCEDIGPGKGINVSYPIVVRTLQGEDWYEAADIYKNWAVNQYWCQNGLLSDYDNRNKSEWLLNEIGLSTFGINAGADRAEWIDKYHEYIPTKMFHILGPDWTQKIQSFGNGVPGGYEDWFPTKFNNATLQAIESNGDKYAPFEFDYLFNINGADGEKGKKAFQKIPKDPTKSIDKYHFPFVCPVDPYVKDLHVRRDETLMTEKNVDSIYYDISANNIMKNCLDESHGHTKGAGRQITMAYRENYISTKEAITRAANGRYTPMGTEMINEVFLDVLDYYQARAGGQPAAPLEGWNIRELLKSGKAELIPMFTYVYHEYGAVRLDGWGKLVEEIGNLFYFTVARTYLWGGLYELNYEYSPMEVCNDRENTPNEHYYPFEPRGYKFSPERAAYIARFAELRTGLGNKYLAYGKMLRPLEFTTNTTNLNWFQYNCSKEFVEYNDSGILTVNTIIHSAWQYQDKSIGLFFANVDIQKQKINITLDMRNYELINREEVKVHSISEDGKTELFTIKTNEERSLGIEVPGRSVIMVEIFEN